MSAQTGRLPLTPIQAFYFSHGAPSPAHFNSTLLLEVDASLPDNAVRAAVDAVLARHDAFRLRFRRTDAGWEPAYDDGPGFTLERVDLAALPPEKRDGAQNAAADARHASLDLRDGPLGRAVLFDRGAEGRFLLLLLHHLAVDAVSLEVLREELERACVQAAAGESVDLGPAPATYADWTRALAAYAAGGAADAEATYWLAHADGIPPLPADGAGGNTEADSATVTVWLDEAETRVLRHEVPAAYGATVEDALLLALADALREWTGGARVRVALEVNGREAPVAAGMDFSRTVGWFTHVHPVVLDPSDDDDPAARLLRVHGQLRAAPARGIGHGVLRWMTDGEAARRLSAQPDPQVAFHYQGPLDEDAGPVSRLRMADGPVGRGWAAGTPRWFALEVTSAIYRQRLAVSWTYGEGAHRRDTIQRVADAALRSLRTLIASARRTETKDAAD